MESEWQAELILLVALGTLFPSTWACLRMGTELRGLAAVLARHLFPVSLTFSEISSGDKHDTNYSERECRVDIESRFKRRIHVFQSRHAE